MNRDELYHYGVKGMKWRHHKYLSNNGGNYVYALREQGAAVGNKLRGRNLRARYHGSNAALAADNALRRYAGSRKVKSPRQFAGAARVAYSPKPYRTAAKTSTRMLKRDVRDAVGDLESGARRVKRKATRAFKKPIRKAAFKNAMNTQYTSRGVRRISRDMAVATSRHPYRTAVKQQVRRVKRALR